MTKEKIMGAPATPQSDRYGAVTKSALISDCGTYRYHLGRVWNPEQPRLGWIMLNPSTSDANLDDPTIRRCMGFGRQWAYGGIEVVNLFAYRATDPADLMRCPVNVTGPANYDTIRATAERCPVMIAAWGAHPVATRIAVNNALAAVGQRSTLYVLGLTKGGAPRHPLYMPNATEPVRWERT